MRPRSNRRSEERLRRVIIRMMKHLAVIVLVVCGTIGMAGCIGIPVPDTHVKWGMSLHYGDMTEADTELHLDNLSIELLRLDIKWSEIEGNNGQFDFTKYDAAIDKYGAENFIAILIGPPGWAEQMYEDDKDQYWLEWQEYVEAVCTRYNFYYYQIDNEMNHLVGSLVGRWLYDYDDRPIVIEKAGEVLAEYDSSYKTIVNVMANSPNWYGDLNNWLDKAGDHIDIIGVDHYSETWTARANKWRPLNIVMEETIRQGSNFYGKDVAICEMGYSTYREGTHGDIQQERWINIEVKGLRDIVNAYNSRAYGSKFVFVVWYKLHEGGELLDYNPEKHFGIIHKDGTLKMGYDDLKAQIAGFN